MSGCDPSLESTASRGRTASTAFDVLGVVGLVGRRGRRRAPAHERPRSAGAPRRDPDARRCLGDVELLSEAHDRSPSAVVGVFAACGFPQVDFNATASMAAASSPGHTDSPVTARGLERGRRAGRRDDRRRRQRGERRGRRGGRGRRRLGRRHGDRRPSTSTRPPRDPAYATPDRLRDGRGRPPDAPQDVHRQRRRRRADAPAMRQDGTTCQGRHVRRRRTADDTDARAYPGETELPDVHARRAVTNGDWNCDGVVDAAVHHELHLRRARPRLRRARALRLHGHPRLRGDVQALHHLQGSESGALRDRHDELEHPGLQVTASLAGSCPSCPTSRSTSSTCAAASSASRSSTCASPARSSCARSTRRCARREGKRVLGVRRMGKRIVFDLEGDLHPRPAPDDRRAAALARARARRCPARSGLAAFDFPGGHADPHRGVPEEARVAPPRARARRRSQALDPGGLEPLTADADAVRRGPPPREPHGQALAHRSAPLQRHRQRVLRRDPLARAACRPCG